MALRDEAKGLVEYYYSYSNTLEHNKKLFEIYEGDLLKYILHDLQKQLSANSYNTIQHRVSPINVLRKLIDRLSKIYQQGVIRELNEPSTKNIELFGWYLSQLSIDMKGTQWNESYNMYKNSALEPYVDAFGFPKLRVIPSTSFVVKSNDPTDPMRVTHYVKCMGKYNNKHYFYLYTDQEFLAVNDQGQVIDEIMMSLNNPEGVNPFGKIPMVYVNYSKNELMPRPDTDLLSMVKLFPILLSDLNFSIMFQTFSVMYGIDINADNIPFSPNTFLSFKSDPTSDKTPSIGTLKPEADIEAVMNYIFEVMSVWFNTRGIKTGEMGSLQKNASGISKMLDELDVNESRAQQIEVFEEAEEKLWELLIENMIPIWVRMPGFQNKAEFDLGTSVEVEFKEPEVMESTQSVIDNQIKLLQNGLTTRKKAIMKIHNVDQELAGEMLKEIETGSEILIEE